MIKNVWRNAYYISGILQALAVPLVGLWALEQHQCNQVNRSLARERLIAKDIQKQ